MKEKRMSTRGSSGLTRMWLQHSMSLDMKVDTNIELARAGK